MRQSLLVGLLGCLLVGTGLLWSAFAGPMLLHFKSGALQCDKRFVIWNPFRNKEPERFGTQLLAAIHSSECREAMVSLEVPAEENRGACEKQERRPLVGSCALVERRDKGNTVWLLFQCSQEAHCDVLADVGLSLRHRGKKWVLEGYERIY